MVPSSIFSRILDFQSHRPNLEILWRFIALSLEFQSDLLVIKFKNRTIVFENLQKISFVSESSVSNMKKTKNQGTDSVLSILP